MTRPVLDEFNRGTLDVTQASYPGRERDGAMRRHLTTLVPNGTRYCGLVVVALILTTTLAFGERFTKDVRFTGTAVSSEHVSGFQGTAFVVGVPDANGNDDYAVFGITSEEQRDHPCFVKVMSENINDWSAQQELAKELCDGSPSSAELTAAYGNPHYGKRSFVTGIRVCMNDQDDRVKGFQIRGRTLSDFGTLQTLERDAPGKKGERHPPEPKDERPNCHDNWKRWALCPKDDQIATAVVLHFGAGTQPRSLIGIGLQCRTVQEPAPVTGTPF